MTNEATCKHNVDTFKALRVEVMETIGIKELKETLSRYMKRVKTGAQSSAFLRHSGRSRIESGRNPVKTLDAPVSSTGQAYRSPA